MRTPAALLTGALLLAACRSDPSPAPAAPAASTSKAAVCYRIVAMADERQRRLECASGESFTLRLGADGKWSQEARARAGMVPGYATPEEAGKALCGCS